MRFAKGAKFPSEAAIVWGARMAKVDDGTSGIWRRTIRCPWDTMVIRHGTMNGDEGPLSTARHTSNRELEGDRTSKSRSNSGAGKKQQVEGDGELATPLLSLRLLVTPNTLDFDRYPLY